MAATRTYSGAPVRICLKDTLLAFSSQTLETGSCEALRRRSIFPVVYNNMLVYYNAKNRKLAVSAQAYVHRVDFRLIVLLGAAIHVAVRYDTTVQLLMYIK